MIWLTDEVVDPPMKHATAFLTALLTLTACGLADSASSAEDFDEQECWDMVDRYLGFGGYDVNDTSHPQFKQMREGRLKLASECIETINRLKTSTAADVELGRETLRCMMSSTNMAEYSACSEK